MAMYSGWDKVIVKGVCRDGCFAVLLEVLALMAVEQGAFDIESTDRLVIPTTKMMASNDDDDETVFASSLKPFPPGTKTNAINKTKALLFRKIIVSSCEQLRCSQSIRTVTSFLKACPYPIPWQKN